jgi:hypothetical protein
MKSADPAAGSRSESRAGEPVQEAVGHTQRPARSAPTGYSSRKATISQAIQATITTASPTANVGLTPTETGIAASYAETGLIKPGPRRSQDGASGQLWPVQVPRNDEQAGAHRRNQDRHRCAV